MAVEDHRRIQLFERLMSVLGQEHAVTMLEMLPPPGQDVLTREDVRLELERALAPYVTHDDLDRALSPLRQDLTHLRQDLSHLRQDLSHYATKADLYRIFTAQTIALAAVLGAAAAFFG